MAETIAPAWIPTDADFGSRLALVRHRMGWNVKEAARECQVAPATWRLWEVDGALPRNIITIAMSIATRTGCDYLWLVHGPSRGGAPTPTSTMGRRQHVVATMPAFTAAKNDVPDQRLEGNRPVRQTRPIIGGRPQPLSVLSPS